MVGENQKLMSWFISPLHMEKLHKDSLLNILLHGQKPAFIINEHWVLYVDLFSLRAGKICGSQGRISKSQMTQEYITTKWGT